MLPFLLVIALGTGFPAGPVTHAILLEPARHTLDLLYNMEFEAALHAAQDIMHRAPTHPAGHFYRAATYWQWRLITYEPAPRARLLSQFQEAVQRTRELAEHLPATQATEAAFYLGAVYGMQARMHFVEKQYVRALLAAKQGSTYLQQCVTRAPEWYDAYAGLGTYQYVLSRVPGFWRPIVQQLIGLPGDRAKGLQDLEQARTHGQLSGPEAASLLAKIYTLPGEQHYAKAYTLLEPLVQRYPQNLDYRYRLALVCALLQRWTPARQLSQSLVADIEHRTPSAAPQWVPLLHYRVAETYVFQQEPGIASTLLQMLQSQQLAPALRAWVELRLGNVHDMQGERQAALAWYRGVKGDADAEHLSQVYLSTPFTPTQVVLKPLEQAVI